MAYPYKTKTSISIERTDFKIPSKAYLLSVGERQFYCSLLIKSIVEGLMKELSLEQICHYLGQIHSSYQKISTQDLEAIIEKKIIPMGVLADSAAPKEKNDYLLVNNKSVKFQKTLLNTSQVQFFARLFTFTYQRIVAVVLIAVGLIAHLTHFWYYPPATQYLKIWQEASAIDYVLLYLLTVVIFIFHEIGHAAAAWRYGIQTPRVGFGIYLIYPVFFTDINKAWKLSTTKRIVINIGGVYFQWIIGTLLVFVSLLFPELYFLQAIVLLNLVRMLHSFMPFIKADGYWIYSDGFDIQNLRQKSNQFLINIFRNHSWKATKSLVGNKTQHIALTFHAFGTVAFFGFWFFLLFRMIWLNVPILPELVSTLYQQLVSADSFSTQLQTLIQFLVLFLLITGVLVFLFRLAIIIKSSVKELLKKPSEVKPIA